MTTSPLHRGRDDREAARPGTPGFPDGSRLAALSRQIKRPEPRWADQMALAELIRLLLVEETDGSVRGASPRRSGRTRFIANPVVTRSSKSRPAKPLSPMSINPGRSVPGRVA